MKSLVTGGAGFIGSHIVDALLSRGDEVLVVDDLSTGVSDNATRHANNPNYRFEEFSIVEPRLRDVIASFKPNCVFHTAAQVNVRRSMSEPEFDSQVNIVGTVNLLEACRLNGVSQVVFSSTGGAVYGEQEQFPAAEDHPINPDSAYGLGKRCCELYLQYFSKVYSLTSVALRYTNVYGPRQNPKGEAGVVAIFTERLMQGEPLKVNGDGEQTRDFVYVADVVRANLLAAEKCAGGSSFCFNVGTGKESSVLDVVKIFEELWDGEFETFHGPTLPGEQRRSVVETALAQRELGWRAEMELKEGLRDTLKSFTEKSDCR